MRWNYTKDKHITPKHDEDIIVCSIDGCYCRSVKYDEVENTVNNSVDDMPSFDFEYFELWMSFPKLDYKDYYGIEHQPSSADLHPDLDFEGDE
jgi:hypothetical protein